MKATDIPRWASGSANYETVFDGSDGHGRCRWCGAKMSAHYPKNGRALNYRCCSLFCQILYGAHLRYFVLPLKANGELNVAEGKRELASLEDVTIRSNQTPDWFDAAKPTFIRQCANGTDGKHSLPHNPRKGQEYCDSRCRVAAHRAKRPDMAFIVESPTVPLKPSFTI